MGLFDFLKSKRFEELLDIELEGALAVTENEDEIYCEITENYVTLLNILGVNRFSEFSFPDYEDCRRITVDGVEYDFDGAFIHDDMTLTELVSANDCMMADLGGDMQTILRTVERMMKDQACP